MCELQIKKLLHLSVYEFFWWIEIWKLLKVLSCLHLVSLIFKFFVVHASIPPIRNALYASVWSNS